MDAVVSRESTTLSPLPRVYASTGISNAGFASGGMKRAAAASAEGGGVGVAAAAGAGGGAGGGGECAHASASMSERQARILMEGPLVVSRHPPRQALFRGRRRYPPHRRRDHVRSVA